MAPFCKCLTTFRLSNFYFYICPLMKFFAFIMSFYLLALSCYPCGDSQECDVKAEAKISQSDVHQQHNHNKEACTPFCTCSCCPSSVFFTPFAKAQDTHVHIQSIKYSLFDITFDSDVFSSIWQPPRLS